MSKRLIGSYQNGNYTVFIFNDGTKIKYSTEDELKPAFSETIDIKITNKCSMGCAMCHEKSTVNGTHADLNDPLLDTIRPFTELAIGGGNPIEHPDLVNFLQRMKDRKVICNLTVNMNHFFEHRDLLLSWADRGLVHGVGISVYRPLTEDEVKSIASFPNSIVHVIAGLASIKMLDSLSDHDIRLLILGYKLVGRGIDYYEDNWKQIEEQTKELEQMVLDVWSSRFKLISFDNLAIEQLELKSKIDPETWNTSYMGEEGSTSMYIDFVDGKYAVASTMERYPIPVCVESVDDLFSFVQTEAKK